MFKEIEILKTNVTQAKRRGGGLVTNSLEITLLYKITEWSNRINADRSL